MLCASSTCSRRLHARKHLRHKRRSRPHALTLCPQTWKAQQHTPRKDWVWSCWPSCAKASLSPPPLVAPTLHPLPPSPSIALPCGHTLSPRHARLEHLYIWLACATLRNGSTSEARSQSSPTEYLSRRIGLCAARGSALALVATTPDALTLLSRRRVNK